MNWRSSTLRFATLVFALQLVAAAILLLGVAILLRVGAEADAIDLARNQRDDLLAIHDEGGLAALRRDVAARAQERGEHFTVLLLVDGKGRRLAGNLAALPPRLVPGAPYTAVRARREGHRTPETMLVQVARLGGGARLLTGTVFEKQREIFAQLRAITLLSLVSACGLAALAAFVLTRLIVRRLKGTVATLQAVRAGQLDRRIPIDTSGDAFARLGSEINRALDRVAQLNGELKLATDSLGHDLKSPLTRLRTVLDRMAGEAAGSALEPLIAQASGESERLLAIVETSLSITRAEAGIGRESFAPCDLQGVLETMVDIYEPVFEDLGRAIVLAPGPHARRAVHRQLLDTALANLVDNALKYGAGTVTLGLTARGEDIALFVADEGPGIPAARRAEALRRHGRLDA
ncbi:HAMP domain-containing histidine kinase, partial [Novosphingobium sp. 1949]